jgi:hypothetical protein
VRLGPITRALPLALVLAAPCLAACDDPPEDDVPAPLPHRASSGLTGVTVRYGEGSILEGGLTLDPPSVEGPLSLRAVTTVLDDRGDELQFCYQHALEGRREDAPQGDLVAAFTVGANGAVARPVTLAEDQLHLAPLSQCVTGSLAAWTFPTSSAESHVRCTMHFSFDPPAPG